MRRTLSLLVTLAVLVSVVPAGAAAPTASGSATLAQEECTFPVSTTDATGTQVTVEQPPEEIVVLQASSAQVLWELGIQDRVVGMPVKSYTSYLDGSESKTDVINDDGTVNQEQVVALEPDLVLAPNVIPNETIDQLRNAGLTVHKSGFPSSLSGIRTEVSVYGELTGTCEQAATVNEEFDSAVEEIRENAADRYQPRTFYYFFNFTAGEGTFSNEVIETAGGRNVVAEAGVSGFRQVSLEQVAERDPEVVFVASDSPMPSGEVWNSTTAFQEGNVYRVNVNLLNQPAPRVVEPMAEMEARLSERAAAVETATPTPTATPAPPEPTAPPTDSPTPTETSAADGPGFGLVGGLVALLAGSLFLARRR